MKMRKLWMLSAVVLLLFAGVAAAQDTSSKAAPLANVAPMQTFTSTDGRFSILFPGTPQQTSQVVNLKNGDSTTIYQFSAEADSGNTSYIVMYNDYSAAVVADSPQALLDPDGYNYEVHEYLAGTRFYQLIITTSKGFTATQAGAFMNSFRIL
jgi:hypothetical protein